MTQKAKPKNQFIAIIFLIFSIYIWYNLKIRLIWRVATSLEVLGSRICFCFFSGFVHCSLSFLSTSFAFYWFWTSLLKLISPPQDSPKSLSNCNLNHLGALIPLCEFKLQSSIRTFLFQKENLNSKKMIDPSLTFT